MPIKQAILKNSTADKLLIEKGYAIIPFLNEEEITTLKSFFYDNHSTIPEGLYASAHTPDIEFRNKMSDKIKEVFDRANKENFINSKSLGGTFMNKSKGEAGLLYPHQDWNIVDEGEWRSFNVWVPLVGVNAENGSIQVLEKSHVLKKTYRGINIPPAFENSNEAIWKKMQTLEMKAGEALVYDHRLLHASKENKTEKDRLVVVYGIIPEQAEMRYYYLENEKIREYKCSPEFFMKGNPAAGPKGLEKIRDIDYEFPKVVSEKKIEEKKSIFEKIKDWIA